MERGKSLVSDRSCRRRHRKKDNLQLSSLNTNQAHLLLPYTLIKDVSTPIKTTAILNLGATRKGFINKSFINLNKLTFYKLRHCRQLNIVDRRPSSASNITYIVKLDLEIRGHKEKMLFYITKLRKYDIILRKP